MFVFAVIEHSSRRIRILGATAHPTTSWVVQAAKNLVTDLEDVGCRAPALSTAPADHRPSPDRPPEHTKTPTTRRNPPRVRTCRLNCMDGVSGKRSPVRGSTFPLARLTFRPCHLNGDLFMSRSDQSPPPGTARQVVQVPAEPTPDPAPSKSAWDLPDVSNLVVGVLGGTGPQGKGLAYRLARAGPEGDHRLAGRPSARKPPSRKSATASRVLKTARPHAAATS
jgi:hypothetical protein